MKFDVSTRMMVGPVHEGDSVSVVEQLPVLLGRWFKRRALRSPRQRGCNDHITRVLGCENGVHVRIHDAYARAFALMACSVYSDRDLRTK